MKDSTRAGALLIVGSLLIGIDICAKPLGITEGWAALAILAGGVCYLGSIRASRRAKRAQGAVAPGPNDGRRKKRFWLVSGSLIAGSILMLPLLPYLVDDFRPGLYWFVIPAQIVVIVLFMIFFHRKLMREDTL